MPSARASLSVCALIVLVAAAVPGPAGAQTPAVVAGGEVNSMSLAPRAETTQLGVSVGAGETDNVFLSSAPTHSQTLGMLGLDFNVQREGTPLDVDSKGDLQYVDYLQHAYGEQLYGRFDGTAALQLIPGVWKWVVQDHFGQAQLDPTAPLLPTNLENVNVLSTGPDLKLRLGATGFVEMGLRYALAHYETSPLSGNRELANLTVGEEISSASSISLNVDDQRLRFNNTVINTDYDLRDLYARYQLLGARTAVDLDVGASQTDNPGHWVSVPLAQLSARRLLSPSTTLTLAVGHQLTDAMDSFCNLKSGTGSDIVIAPVRGTGDTYLSNYASAKLKVDRNRTVVTFLTRWERDSYAQFATLDASRAAVSMDLERRITPTWSLDVLGSWQRIHYDGYRYYETDWPVGAALVMSPGKRVVLTLRVDHIHHEVVGPGVTFEENRALLTAEYWPWR